MTLSSKIYLASQSSLMNPKAIVNICCWSAIGSKGQFWVPMYWPSDFTMIGEALKFFLIILILMITCKLWRPIGKFEVCHCWSLILANICFLSTQTSPTKLQWQSWNNYTSIKLPIVLTPTLNVLIGTESLKSYVKFFLQLKDIREKISLFGGIIEQNVLLFHLLKFSSCIMGKMK
jgi:hypothetical protein